MPAVSGVVRSFVALSLAPSHVGVASCPLRCRRCTIAEPEASPTVTPTPERSDITSFQLRKALDGDLASLGSVVQRVNPLLLNVARRRIGRSSRIDPEDVVAEAWRIYIEKRPTIEPRDGRFTPSFLKYLSTTIVHVANNALRKEIREQMRRREPETPSTTGAGGIWDGIEARLRNLVRSASESEMNRKVDDCLDGLDPEDRELVIQRAVEGAPYGALAERLNEKEATLRQRYARALGRLRKCLSGAVFDELLDD